ncbi:mitogen-activated protein kinase kinase kinase YODA-like [Oryza glaberrima]|uniref:mitogen-activated protein kinase kinase kinase n=1 Tax=Oryza glaberrima TaxID=4538 RepID=I1PNT7_ORYGL|nr:mitogen-activated protein kinase kinase kinase YODA-like [Oryza glaberrima]XP_052152054.1 mitogen-activated protein kinase kinase kinase YODA-like [Oryza glaberrima]XP_052152055.1 mitogen-activated protein kinase kinase kinase YODA-like [Oryza glaberrima]XP_052152056.1 mitogen-activated protein kinase kinase kinase YODA-like [Oryza glaberrima]
MPPWWGKSFSKDAKKTTKENLIDTFHRLISPNDQKGSTKSKRSCRRGNDSSVEKSCRSTTVSRPTSPSKEVSRCQSFSADRPHAHPLPIPGVRPPVTRTVSDITESKPILEKRGKPPLLLPLPKPNRPPRRHGNSEVVSEIVVASPSSNCSDSDDHGDSQLQSPVGNDAENATLVTLKNKSSNARKECPGPITAKNMKEIHRPANQVHGSHILSTSPRGVAADSYQSNLQNPRPLVLDSAPNSLMSSPSRSPRRICPDHIPTSAFWAVKPHTDVTFVGSGQCSSPGSGQTSGHNSVGGDMLAQLFWQPSRSSPECSPIPSPRMTSPGPSSRVHSGSVSPLHPRSGGMAPESPTNRHDDGKKKQTHKLPLPPLSISHSSFHPNNSTPTSPISVPRSPGRTENPPSPGSRWKKGKLIGRGTFGHVYVGFNSDSGEMCAMKEVTLFLDDPKSKESAKQLGQEISLLSRLQHPNIVQYYGSETVDDKLYIYLEYVSGGSIHKLLQEYGQLGEQAIRSYTQQILSGLAYLHAKNTVHRDIKGANILVDPSGRVKLADFGMAKHINGQQCPFSFKGSPYWMAPEVIKNSNGCNLAVDIWSLGCTVLEMATSKPPWSQYEGIAAMFKIGNSKELPPIPDHLSEPGKDFIRKCLQRDPSQRPTAMELLQHPFVQKAVSLEKSVLSEPLEHLAVISCRPSAKMAAHTRNISSLGLEGQTIYQRRGAKFSSKHSDMRIRSNISCPVSPCGSPLLKSRSPQHSNGRMSPSPISSPRTTSGTSTPLSGGNGAIPFNHLKQSTYSNEGFAIPSRSPDDLFASRPTDPDLGQFIRVHQVSQGLQERVVSEADILSPQFGKRLGNVFDLRDKLSPSERFTHHAFVDHVKLNPSLDLTSGSPHLGLKHGN